MQSGLHALGIGTGARRDVIDAVAAAAEGHGFSRLWAGEHVVMVDEPQSRYPYAADGRIEVPAAADWLDPLVALSFPAATTSRIGLATGVLLLSEHNPVVLAKQAASLDVLSGGRLTLGVGVGWSREESAALGVPFAGRRRRAVEYAQVMRALWRDDVASSPASSSLSRRSGSTPSRLATAASRSCWAATAMRRCAEPRPGATAGTASICPTSPQYASGWPRCRGCAARPADRSPTCTWPWLSRRPIARAAALAEAGVDELVVVDSPPEDPGMVSQRLGALGEPWGLSAHRTADRP